WELDLVHHVVRDFDSDFERLRRRRHRCVDAALGDGVSVITQVSGTAGIGGGVAGRHYHVGNDDHVAIPAAPGSDSPKYLGIIEDVDIFIHHHDVFHAPVHTQRSDDRLPSLARRGLFYLDIGMEAAAAGGRQM